MATSVEMYWPLSSPKQQRGPEHLCSCTDFCVSKDVDGFTKPIPMDANHRSPGLQWLSTERSEHINSPSITSWRAGARVV